MLVVESMHACVFVCTCMCVCMHLSVLVCTCVCVCVHVWMHMCAGVHQLACIKRHSQQPSAKAYWWISELNQLIVVQQAVLILQWRQPGILQHFFQFPAMCLLHGGAQFNMPVQEHNFLFSLAWPDIQFGFPVRCETTTASLGQDQVWNPSCVKQLMKTSGWESLLSHIVKFLGLFTYIYTKQTWRWEKKSPWKQYKTQHKTFHQFWDAVQSTVHTGEKRTYRGFSMYALCVSGTLNTQGFVWKFFYVLYKFSFIHSFYLVQFYQ